VATPAVVAREAVTVVARWVKVTVAVKGVEGDLEGTMEGLAGWAAERAAERAATAAMMEAETVGMVKRGWAVVVAAVGDTTSNAASFHGSLPNPNSSGMPDE
jgi:hypothetical protein